MNGLMDYPALGSGRWRQPFSPVGSTISLPRMPLTLKVAHPEMLKAITAAKKKNDRADAEMIADLLRVNLLPECYMLLGQKSESCGGYCGIAIMSSEPQ